MAILFPRRGYVGDAMQPLTDVGIDLADNVWVANNWGTLDPVTARAGGQNQLCAVVMA